MNFLIRQNFECPRHDCNGVLVELGHQDRKIRRLRCNICHAKTIRENPKILAPEE